MDCRNVASAGLEAVSLDCQNSTEHVRLDCPSETDFSLPPGSGRYGFLLSSAHSWLTGLKKIDCKIFLLSYIQTEPAHETTVVFKDLPKGATHNL